MSKKNKADLFEQFQIKNTQSHTKVCTHNDISPIKTVNWLTILDDEIRMITKKKTKLSRNAKLSFDFWRSMKVALILPTNQMGTDRWKHISILPQNEWNVIKKTKRTAIGCDRISSLDISLRCQFDRFVWYLCLLPSVTSIVNVRVVMSAAACAAAVG